METAILLKEILPLLIILCLNSTLSKRSIILIATLCLLVVIKIIRPSIGNRLISIPYGLSTLDCIRIPTISPTGDCGRIHLRELISNQIFLNRPCSRI